MNVLLACAVTLTLSASSSLAWAQAPSAAISVDDGYILALSTADRVMHAWAARDADAGRALLTPAATKKYSAADLAMLFQGTSSPHHQSFEIGPGRKLSATRYAFEVVEYEYLTNMNFKGPRPKPARLVVVEASPGTWLVDEFPN